MSINKVMITGNLTRDPELRTTGSGMQVLGFGVAVNDRRQNKQTGEWENVPNFVDCTMFGTRAQSVSQYLHKGGKVAIEGKLHFSSWQDKYGNNRSKLEVVVDEIELMQQNAAQGGNYAQGAQNYQPTQNQPANGQQMPQTGNYSGDASVYDEDIPF